MNARADAITVRHYADADEPALMRLLTESMGGGPTGERSPEFFRWKHLQNPFGRSLMLVAESEGRLIGFRAFMRWKFEAGGRVISAARAVDTATHPDFQGRGIFTMLTLQAIDELRGETDLIYNTPNEKSLPGYLKMGWSKVGNMPVNIKVRRPLAVLRGLAGRGAHADSSSSVAREVNAMTADEGLAQEGVADLVRAASENQPAENRLHTKRDIDYLRWRYGSAPLLGYRMVVHEDRGRVAGIGIFRVRPRGNLVETTLSEVLYRPGDVDAVGKVISAVVAAAPVDHIACSFPSGTPEKSVSRRRLFLPAPGGMTFTVNPLNQEVGSRGLSLDSWGLTLGDLEVF